MYEYLLASEESNHLLTSITDMVDIIADGREITLLHGLEGLGAPRARFLCPPEIILWEITGTG